MIFFVCALYIEAEPLIKKLNLCRNSIFEKFDVYSDENIYAVITGSGKINCSAALGYVFSKIEAAANDIVINYGICASFDKNAEIGKIFFVNKIIDYDTGFIYYPETIFKTGLKEKTLLSVSKVLSAGDGDCLVDMEASAIYSVCSRFFKSHQIFFFKIVSDYSENISLNKAEIAFILNNNIEYIYGFAVRIHCELNRRGDLFSEDERKLLEGITYNLKLSKTNAAYLFKLAKYARVSDNSVLEEYKDITAVDKKQGKVLLNEIKYRLLQ